MPRTARIAGPGLAHHVTQRSNNRQDVFFVDDDWRAYLELFREQAEKFALTILGYCLMASHVHLIAVPDQPDSLAKAVGRTNFRYTQYLNHLHGRSGHLWQNRFLFLHAGRRPASLRDARIIAQRFNAGYPTPPRNKSRRDATIIAQRFNAGYPTPP